MEDHKKEKKEEIKNNKDKKKNNNEKENEKESKKHIFLYEVKFLVLFVLELLLIPLKLIFYSFKKEPLKAFEKLKQIIEKDFFKYHKKPLILVLINLVVFLLYLISKKLGLLNAWELIFVSNPKNMYLFNLNFIAHYDLKHLIWNLLFLYYLSYILSFRVNVIKYYFIIGFIENFIIFILSFFIKIPENLGASGVISAFLILALVFYPLSFSLVLFIIYSLTGIFIILYPLEFIKDLQSFINYGIVEEKIFTLNHIIGYFVGVIIAYLKWKELNKVNKIILVLLSMALIVSLVFFIVKN